MTLSRRSLLKVSTVGVVGMTIGARGAAGQTTSPPAVEANDRVFICNEDSNTLSVIDPRTNTVDTTVNLTSFDEDPGRPSVS
jgi:YVTN family beta-propeller protein